MISSVAAGDVVEVIARLDQNEFPAPTVLPVQIDHGMPSSAGSGEEIQYASGVTSCHTHEVLRQPDGFGIASVGSSHLVQHRAGRLNRSSRAKDGCDVAGSLRARFDGFDGPALRQHEPRGLPPGIPNRLQPAVYEFLTELLRAPAACCNHRRHQPAIANHDGLVILRPFDHRQRCRLLLRPREIQQAAAGRSPGSWVHS